MAKTRKCCCTPEPYRHLLYLSLYLERVSWISTQLSSCLYSDLEQGISSKPEGLHERKGGALFQRFGRLGHIAICCALATHSHQICSTAHTYGKRSRHSRFSAGLEGISEFRTCAKSPKCPSSSYRFFSSSFSHLELKTIPSLSSRMPYNGLIPVIFGHSKPTAHKGLIPLVAAHIASSTTRSRDWKSWRRKR